MASPAEPRSLGHQHVPHAGVRKVADRCQRARFSPLRPVARKGRRHPKRSGFSLILTAPLRGARRRLSHVRCRDVRCLRELVLNLPSERSHHGSLTWPFCLIATRTVTVTSTASTPTSTDTQTYVEPCERPLDQLTEYRVTATSTVTETDTLYNPCEC